MERYVVSFEGREEYDLLIKWADNQGYKWLGGSPVRMVDVYKTRDKPYAVSIKPDKHLGHAALAWYKAHGNIHGPIVSFEEFAIEEGIYTNALPDDYF
jgi:hypothetical protein